jgi:hypothetical protein
MLSSQARILEVNSFTQNVLINLKRKSLLLTPPVKALVSGISCNNVSLFLLKSAFYFIMMKILGL